MKSILSSRWFWFSSALAYCFIMIAACIVAEGHMQDGGGNSDVTVWGFEWHWSSLAELDTFYMVCFLFALVLPWLFAIYIPPRKPLSLYSVLLSVHILFSLLLFVIYVGSVLYGLFADMDANFDDWCGEGLYPSPVDQWTNHILLFFFGPIVLIYGLTTIVVGTIANKNVFR